MVSLIKIMSILSMASLSCGQGFDAKVETSEAKDRGSISLQPPDLSDDESHYSLMPKHLRCDGCRAITIKMTSTLTEKSNIYPSIRDGEKTFSDVQLMEIFDTVCSTEGNDGGFVVRDVDGVLTLVYPGSVHYKTPGVSMAGGMWDHRFMTMCMGFLGDFDEDEIYAAYQIDKENGIFNLLCTDLCRDEKQRQYKEQKEDL